MKILIYSDLHLYNHHKLSINSETALNVLNFIKNYSRDHGIKKIICAGDFFHAKSRVYAPHVVQSLLIIKEIYKLGVEQYFIIGNHDMASVNSYLNSILFVFSDYSKIVSDYYFFDIDSARVHLLNYTTYKFDDFVLSKNKNILVTHLDIKDFYMSNNVKCNNGFNLSDFNDFDLVVSGHFHEFQQKENVVYVGSPYQISFSEKDQKKGFILLDTESLKFEFVEIDGLPKYKYIEIDNLNQIKREEVENCFLRVKLNNEKISRKDLKNKLLEYGTLSIDIIPFETNISLEYSLKEFSDNPLDIANAYIESINNLDLDKNKLLKYFEKIRDFSNNYEI